MRIPLYQIDAFTDRVFAGNPAAVCPLGEWLPDATMQAIAAENNLAETAFFFAQEDRYLLRVVYADCRGRALRSRHARLGLRRFQARPKPADRRVSGQAAMRGSPSPAHRRRASHPEGRP
jgi:hypothetical protein